jgi:hypothetical protein
MNAPLLAIFGELDTPEGFQSERACDQANPGSDRKPELHED